MKKRLLFPILVALTLGVSACDMSETYVPGAGGVVDTLHNEIHVESYQDLIDLAEGKGSYGKDSTKVYFTDDDGLKYKWNGSSYECVSEKNTTINFYFDNTQTTDEDGKDAPIFSIHWFLLKPLGSEPEEINSMAKVIALGAQFGFVPDEKFPTFIGFSAYPTCLDENKLWNYETDYRQQAVTNLYGIWVD